jgi:hypothetical protein
MSAAYTLVGDVIEVKEPISIGGRDGILDGLAPGYFCVLGQFDVRRVLVCAGEDDEGHVVAVGDPFTVPATILETDATGGAYLKAKRWIRDGTESP